MNNPFNRFATEAELEAFYQGYAMGVAEARGLGNPRAEVTLQTSVSHHGSDCDTHYTHNMEDPDCRGVLVIRRDCKILSTDVNVKSSVDGFVIGDWSEGPAFKHTNNLLPEDPFYYGGSFWDKVVKKETKDIRFRLGKCFLSKDGKTGSRDFMTRVKKTIGSLSLAAQD